MELDLVVARFTLTLQVTQLWRQIWVLGHEFIGKRLDEASYSHGLLLVLLTRGDLDDARARLLTRSCLSFLGFNDGSREGRVELLLLGLLPQVSLEALIDPGLGLQLDHGGGDRAVRELAGETAAGNIVRRARDGLVRQAEDLRRLAAFFSHNSRLGRHSSTFGETRPY